MAPRTKQFSGTTKADYEKISTALQERFDECLNRRDLRDFAEENVQVRLLQFYWRYKLGRSGACVPGKQAVIDEICAHQFPDEIEDAAISASLDLNSFSGETPAEAIKFATIAEANTSLDPHVKSWVRDFLNFSKYFFKKGMPQSKSGSQYSTTKRESDFALTQRKFYSSGSLEEGKERLLKAIGFVFNKHRDTFEKNVAELVSILQGTGLSYLPQGWPPNPRMGNFHYKLDICLGMLQEVGNDLVAYNEAISSDPKHHIHFTQEYLDILDDYELGLSPRRKNATAEDAAHSHRTWCDSYLEFYRENGHYYVMFHTSAPVAYIGLYDWVHQVRTCGFERIIYPDDHDYPPDDATEFIRFGHPDYPDDVELDENGKPPVIRPPTLNLPDDVRRDLIEIGFLEFIELYTRAHKRELRAETYYLDALGKKIRELSGMDFLGLVTLDSIFEDGEKLRPDLFCLSSLPRADGFPQGIKVATLIEYDENAHNERAVEAEQRKVIKEIICCAKNEINYIHLIRVNGGSRRVPDPRQVELNAEMLCNELFRDSQAASKNIAEKLQESPRDIYVRVSLLDFHEHHHHAKAYEGRLIPPGFEVKEISDADDWETLLIYDEVVRETSGASLY